MAVWSGVEWRKGLGWGFKVSLLPFSRHQAKRETTGCMNQVSHAFCLPEEQRAKLLDSRSQARKVRHLVSMDTSRAARVWEMIPVRSIKKGCEHHNPVFTK